jgi:hypothetical protein
MASDTGLATTYAAAIKMSGFTAKAHQKGSDSADLDSADDRANQGLAIASWDTSGNFYE